MNTSQIYIVVSIAAFALVLFLFLVARKKGKKLTPLLGLAWALILVGIIFGEDRLISYGLMGAGVALAVIEVYIAPKRTWRDHARPNGR